MSKSPLLPFIRFSMLLILFLPITVQAALGERQYKAPLHTAEWKVTEQSAVYCQLEHQIPYFGKAVFSQEAGRNLKLRLVTNRRFEKKVPVVFQSETANWHTVTKMATLANLKTTGLDSPVKILSDTAKLAVDELLSGFQPAFYFYDDPTSVPLKVTLSTVRFRDAQLEFSSCLGALHDKNYLDIRTSTLRFPTDEEFPFESDEDEALESMFDYLKVDDRIKEIVVSGHADYRGKVCYNETLSARRAWYVYDLLVARGIEPRLIRVDFYGESRPLTKEKSEAGLVKNRRVTVELLQ